MTYAYNLWIFSILLFGIIIVPGMDMFFVIANALTGGRARGLSATAGVMLGGVFHTVFAAVCVGVLTTLPSFVFTVILLAGAAYMAWIGWTLVRSSITVTSLGSNGSTSMRQAFGQGFVTCILNPKAYMFTLAVYPQFMLVKFGSMLGQALVLGLITIGLWRVGAGSGEEPGFSDGIPWSDDMDQAGCGCGVSGGGGLDGGEGGYNLTKHST
jgi:threonine/homoserine/homoserine lactone efflux protein